MYAQEPDEQVFTDPPLLIVEVLSPDDRMSRMQRKIEDYRSMGCRNVWILDPWRRKAFLYDGIAIVEAKGTLTTDVPRLNLSISDIFHQDIR